MKKIRQAILSALKIVPKLIPDILALIGAIAISYGAYLIFVPIGFITLGIMLIASAVILSKS
jgi:hypothetical protein